MNTALTIQGKLKICEWSVALRTFNEFVPCIEGERAKGTGQEKMEILFYIHLLSHII